MRTRLPGYSYTNDEPRKKQFAGNEREQRFQFFTWFLQQKPVEKKGLNLTNIGYVGAGLMLEKTTGISYENLVAELGKKLNIRFGFGNPNSIDTSQVWGHDQNLVPEPPTDNYKLNWLFSAGNINVSLPDYIKFIQWQLVCLKGRSPLLTKEECSFLYSCLPEFSVGWFVNNDSEGRKIAYNIGNPGTFLTEVHIYINRNRAYIFFTNSQTPKTAKGLSALLSVIEKKYNH